MSALRIWRKSSGKTQEQIAVELGENPKTYSAYERGASPVPPETLIKLKKMGYAGPADQHVNAIPPFTREEFEKGMNDLKAYIDERYKELYKEFKELAKPKK